MSGMRRLLAGFCCCVGLLASTGQAAADNYGAIAYSPSTGAHGWAYDYGSRAAAEQVALSICRRHAGDCIVPIWFRNACGALAVGSGGYGSGWGSNRRLAENFALRSCRKHTGGCWIKRWACTTR
jgi:serine/threonine-protein kinase